MTRFFIALISLSALVCSMPLPNAQSRQSPRDLNYQVASPVPGASPVKPKTLRHSFTLPIIVKAVSDDPSTAAPLNLPDRLVRRSLPPILEKKEMAKDKEKRGNTYQGRATWFNVGLGACGKWNKDSDKIVALPHSQWSSKKCGKWITIKNGKKAVKAMVRDMCPGCGWGSLDLSPATFKALGKLDRGVLKVNWHF